MPRASGSVLSTGSSRSATRQLAELTAAAEARTGDLARTAAARKSFIAGLRGAAAAEHRARRRDRGAGPGRGSARSRAGGRSLSSSTRSPAAAPVAPSAPVPASGPGTLTVLSTGYSIKGRTATGHADGARRRRRRSLRDPARDANHHPGLRQGIAADTGGAVQGSVIDIWFPTQEQALAWGRRTVTITLH